MSDQFNTQPNENVDAAGYSATGEGLGSTPPGTEQPAGEKLGSHREPSRTAGRKMTPEEVGELALKMAREAAYAATGAANMLAVKAKELYEEQRKQIAEKTPEGVDPHFRQFVDTMPDQFKAFMDDALRVYHDLAERGRSVVENLQTQAQKMAENPPRSSTTHVDPFDLKEDASATQAAEQAAAPEQAETDVYPGEAKGEQRF